MAQREGEASLLCHACDLNLHIDPYPQNVRQVEETDRVLGRERSVVMARETVVLEMQMLDIHPCNLISTFSCGQIQERRDGC